MVKLELEEYGFAALTMNTVLGAHLAEMDVELEKMTKKHPDMKAITPEEAHKVAEKVVDLLLKSREAIKVAWASSAIIARSLLQDDILQAIAKKAGEKEGDPSLDLSQFKKSVFDEVKKDRDVNTLDKLFDDMEREIKGEE